MSKLISMPELLEIAPELALAAPEILAVIVAAFTFEDVVEMISEGVSPHAISAAAIASIEGGAANHMIPVINRPVVLQPTTQTPEPQPTRINIPVLQPNAPYVPFPNTASTTMTPYIPYAPFPNTAPLKPINIPKLPPLTGRRLDFPDEKEGEHFSREELARVGDTPIRAPPQRLVMNDTPVRERPARVRLLTSSKNRDKGHHKEPGQVPKGHLSVLLDLLSSSEGGRILDIAPKYRTGGKIPELARMAKKKADFELITEFLSDHNIFLDWPTVGKSGPFVREKIRKQITRALARKNSAEAASFTNDLADLLTTHFGAPADFVSRRNVSDMTVRGEDPIPTTIDLEHPYLEASLREAFAKAKIPEHIGEAWIKELIIDAWLISANVYGASRGTAEEYVVGQGKALGHILDKMQEKITLLANRAKIRVNVPQVIDYLRSTSGEASEAYRGVSIRTILGSMQEIITNPPIARAIQLFNIEPAAIEPADLEAAVAPIRVAMGNAEASLIRAAMGSRVYGTPLYESPFLDVIRNSHNPADGPAPDPDPDPYRTIISVRWGRDRGPDARWFRMNIKSLAIFLGITGVGIEVVTLIRRLLAAEAADQKAAKDETYDHPGEPTDPSAARGGGPPTMPTRDNSSRDFRKDFPKEYNLDSKATATASATASATPPDAQSNIKIDNRRKLMVSDYSDTDKSTDKSTMRAMGKPAGDLSSIQPVITGVYMPDDPNFVAYQPPPETHIPGTGPMRPINPTVNAYLPNSVFDFKTLNGYYAAVRDINVKLQTRGISDADKALLTQQKAKYINAINTLYPSGGDLTVAEVDPGKPIPIVPRLPVYGVKPIVDPKTLQYKSFESSKIYPDHKLEAIMRANNSIVDVFKYNAMVDDMADKMASGAYDNASATTGAGSYKAAYEALRVQAEKVRVASARGGANYAEDGSAVTPGTTARVATDKASADAASVAFTTAKNSYDVDYKRLMDAITRGDQSQIGDLHAQLAVDKQNIVDAKKSLDAVVTQVGYGDALSTNLSNQTLEKFPIGTSDSAKFNRIQQLERGLRNEGMVKNYESGLSTLNRNSATYFDDRERLLKGIYSKFTVPLPTITEMIIPELGVMEGDDLDSRVDFNKDIEVRDNEGEGMARADVVDPNEVRLFLNSGTAARQQQKMFTEFSKVAPGDGLGTMAFNTLRQANAQMDAKQFAHTLSNAPRFNPSLGRRYQSPYITTTVAAQEIAQRQTRPQNQPMMIPTVQGEFGKIQWEVDGMRGNSLMSNHFTPERLSTNRWGEWDNPSNIQQPELSLDRYRYRGVPIQQPRMNGYDYGVPSAQPSTQGNILLSNRTNGYNFTPLMRDDDFEKKGRPAVVKSNLDTYNTVLKHGVGSSRM